MNEVGKVLSYILLHMHSIIEATSVTYMCIYICVCVCVCVYVVAVLNLIAEIV